VILIPLSPFLPPGDGEPDRDFPALDLSKKLKNFNLDDYCLCEIETDIGRQVGFVLICWDSFVGVV
jgi:hypothetical protein